MVDKKDLETGETMRSDEGAPIASAATVAGRAASAAAAKRERPLEIERYVVERQLGSGGMGVVYLAHDVDLKRHVVIKLLRAPQDRERLQREAQAMAKVSHPNVVPIYDVGVHAGEVFLAMEYVDGSDLAGWLRTPRTQRDILDVFVAAGRGLAAAHGVGLVHRDFKPHNVLVSRDGVVKVTDFGLARPEGVEVEQAGTPAYMAPEQIRRDNVDARADQFGFCVALWEALYKELPFAGATIDEIFDNITAGRRRSPARDVRVPSRVAAVLARGLEVDPAKRFPSMTALLAELAPRRRAVVPVAVGVLGAALIAAGVVIAVTRKGSGPTCTGGDEEIAAVWNADKRRAIDEAFRASKRPDAPAAFTVLATRFDRAANDLRAMRREACEATRIRKTQSESVMGLRMDCLAHKRAELAALVEIFASGKSPVEHAPAVALELAGVEACADVKALTSPIAPPDPAKRKSVGELRDRIAAAEALLLATRLDEAIASGRQIVDAAAPLGYAPLTAEAHLFAGKAELGLTKYTEAARSFEEAARSAEVGKHDDVRARAMTMLVSALRGEGKLDEALREAQLARAVLERTGNVPDRVAQLELEVGDLHKMRGNAEEAKASYTRSIEQLTNVGAAGRRGISNAHGSLGHLAFGAGDFDRAFDELELSRKGLVELVGETHPEVAGRLQTQALVRSQQGRVEEARTLIERAIAVHDSYYGKDHPLGFALYTTQGQIHQKLGDIDAAIAAGTKAADLAAKQFGAGHPNHAVMIGALGVIYNAAGRFKEGAEVYERGLAMVEAFHKVPHEDVPIFLNSLGFSLMNAGEHERAVAAHRRALEVVQSLKLEPYAQLHADTLTRIGAAENARGSAKAALVVLTEALEMRTKAKAAPFFMAWTKWELAKAVWETRGDRKRARTLAQEAHDGFAAAGNEKKRKEIETWLAKHK